MVADLNQLQPVSGNLQNTLEHEACRIAADRKDEVAVLLNSERLLDMYETCVWWDGCYYCKDDKEFWYCVKCCFF